MSGSRVLLPLLVVVVALLRGGIILLSAEDGWEEVKEWEDCIMVLINKLVCGLLLRLRLGALRLRSGFRIFPDSAVSIHTKQLHVAVADLTRGMNLLFGGRDLAGNFGDHHHPPPKFQSPCTKQTQHTIIIAAAMIGYHCHRHGPISTRIHRHSTDGGKGHGR